MVTERIIADFGNSVYCDVCNGDFTNSDASGGSLVGSYALCPSCTDKADPREINSRCPEGTSFREWVLRLRNGDNCARIITSDEPEDLGKFL